MLDFISDIEFMKYWGEFNFADLKICANCLKVHLIKVPAPDPTKIREGLDKTTTSYAMLDFESDIQNEQGKYLLIEL